jgi:hypothetical protein
LGGAGGAGFSPQPASANASKDARRSERFIFCP